MTSKKRKIGFIGLALLIALSISVTAVLAFTGDEPTTTWNVTPQAKTFPADRPTACLDDGYEFFDRFNPDDINNGVDLPPGTYTEDIVIDGVTVTVEITVNADNTIDFDITNGVATEVWFKSAQYFLYQYDPKPLFGTGTNTGPVSSDTGLHDGVNQNGQYNALSHLDACIYPIYPLRADKTAAGSFDRTVTWTLDKSVDDNSHEGFAGQVAGTSNWKVVADKTEALGNYQVSGSITVYNDNIFDVPVSISDALNDGSSATVTCPSDTVPAGGSLNCTYTASPADASATLNTATITSNSTEFTVGGAVATADVSFTEKLIGFESGTLSDDNEFNPNDATVISGDTTWTYGQTFTCSDKPADYGTNGEYSFNVPNTAKLNGNLNLSDTENVTVTCYLQPLVPSKTAAGTYDRTVTWTLDKSVDDDSHTGYAGQDAGTSNWKVVADKTEVSDSYVVTGTITIKNSAAIAQDFTVSDVLSDSTVAAVDCDAGTDGDQAFGTVPAAAGGVDGEVSCTYTAASTYVGLVSGAPDTNTATVSAAGNAEQTATATPISYTEKLTGYDSGTLSDDNEFNPNPDTVISGDTTWEYSQKFICSDDPVDYGTNGQYSFDVPNTAKLNGNINLSDTENVKVTCTLDALVATKDAAGSYDRTVTWELDKYVNAVDTENVVYNGNPGDKFPTDWLLYVDKTEVSDNYVVKGKITIKNSAAIAQDFTVSDKLEDGTVAAVDCDAGTDGDQAFGTVPAAAGGVDGETSCTYTAASTYVGLVSGAPNTNTATVSAVGNADQTATATPISYTEELIGVDSGTLTDDRFDGVINSPLFSETVSADANFKLEEDFACSTDRDDYGVDGKYSYSITNEGKLVVDETLTDGAMVTVNCEASFVDIIKTTNGAPADPTQDIAFALYDADGNELEIVSTLDNGANLSFQTALIPGASYSICESPVPAGYTFEISVNGGVVLTYAGPPGEENPTGEIQCFDFVAPDPDTQVTLTFNIENSFPGGAPRTPGYWKNWNTCSDGNQAATAFKLNGGLDPSDPNSAGVFLLDDLLPQKMGDFLTIDSCEEGVSILDARDLTELDKKGDPINRSNDAAYTLARALLAARLNQDAGACTAAEFDFLGVYGFDGTFEELLTAADDVLTAVEFDGSGSFLSPQDLKGKNNPLVPLAEEALYLYEIIDDYNNGIVCTGTPSH